MHKNFKFKDIHLDLEQDEWNEEKPIKLKLQTSDSNNRKNEETGLKWEE